MVKETKLYDSLGEFAPQAMPHLSEALKFHDYVYARNY
jgi:hypothetical protein